MMLPQILERPAIDTGVTVMIQVSGYRLPASSQWHNVRYAAIKDHRDFIALPFGTLSSRRVGTTLVPRRVGNHFASFAI